jgi:hypothetical protein
LSGSQLPIEVAASDDPHFAAMHALIQGYVDRGEMAGAVTLVARGGRIVDLATHGWADLAMRKQMQGDSLFRLASLTKIVTAVAVLTLYEDRRLLLDDPVEQHLPEFRGMQVCVGGEVPAISSWSRRIPLPSDICSHTHRVSPRVVASNRHWNQSTAAPRIGRRTTQCRVTRPTWRSSRCATSRVKQCTTG